MKFTENHKKIIVYGLLVFLIIFNIYLYRNEFWTLADPNDNIFHFALIDEAKDIWKNIFSGKLSVFYLFDSWNERWSAGFPLSTYYAHLPQAILALMGILTVIPLFKIFVFVRTVFLICLPISFFLAARILNLPILFGLLAAFFSQTIFTDGLYGIDVSSFAWRGWGLWAQLSAIFFAPLAFAYTIDYIKNKKNFWKAVFYNFLVGQLHFGILYLLLFSYPVYWLFGLKTWQEWGRRIILVLSFIAISLSYFLLPFFWLSSYRNFSYWDQIWKFDSWGLKQTLIWLTNGDLFDFNRFPFITLLLFCGLFFCLLSGKKILNYLAVLFGGFFILFVGKDFLGSLIKVIPGLSEYHLHRAIVMVQFFGIYIAAWGAYELLSRVSEVAGKIVDRFVVKDQRKFFMVGLTAIGIIIGALTIFLIEKPILKYVKDSDSMIAASNIKFKEDDPDYRQIIDKLRTLPKKRVYAGRPGNWGKDLKIADTQGYMALSRDGFPVIGFLPESWSPNSDPEQFFDESNIHFYDLYQGGYIFQASDKKVPDFAHLILKNRKYALYEVPTGGWFTFGKSSWNVSSKKDYLLNITRLWFGSKLFGNNYPQISLKNNEPIVGKQNIKMIDLNNYSDPKIKNLWQNNPFSWTADQTKPEWRKISETVLINGFSAKFEVKKDCPNCIVVLKESYNPGWQVTINNVKSKSYPVFPFFVGIPLEKRGVYEVTAVYRPGAIKVFLIVFEVVFFAYLYFFQRKKF